MTQSQVVQYNIVTAQLSNVTSVGLQCDVTVEIITSQCSSVVTKLNIEMAQCRIIISKCKIVLAQ